MLIMKSDEVKDTMKESPKRYTNPFLSDEENEKVNMWNNQELFHDKNVMELELELECEMPELLVCYKEGGFHVKDICVDDGIPHGEKILFDDDKHDDIIDDSVHNQLVFSPIEYNSVQDLQNLIIDDKKECEKKEEGNESIDVNELKNVCKDDDGVSDSAPEKLKVIEESDTVLKDVDDYAPEEKMNSGDDLLHDKDRPLPSLKSLLDSINGVHDKDQQPCQNSIEETLKRSSEGNEGEEVGTCVQTTISSNENNALNINNNGKTVISNDHLHEVQNPGTVHERGEGESSFSVTDPVSGRLITYSGQIAFSGSISLRSDSSTTSTRSFAFPILQTEYNSSPVRMAKADRRRLQKHRGWRNGLLCCRF